MNLWLLWGFPRPWCPLAGVEGGRVVGVTRRGPGGCRHLAPRSLAPSHPAAPGHGQDTGAKGMSQEETTISLWDHAPGLLWGTHDTIRATLPSSQIPSPCQHQPGCGTGCPRSVPMGVTLCAAVVLLWIYPSKQLLALRPVWGGRQRGEGLCPQPSATKKGAA